LRAKIRKISENDQKIWWYDLSFISLRINSNY